MTIERTILEHDGEKFTAPPLHWKKVTGEALYIDNSTLSAVSDCDERAVLRYILGLATTEERAALLAGTAAHLAVADWLAGASLDGALETFATGSILPDGRGYRAFAEESVVADDDPKNYLARLAWPNVERIMRQWFETHPLSEFPFRVDPDLIEIGFAYPLTPAGDVIYCGRLDAIVEDRESGHLYVLETKTTGQIGSIWLRQFRVDSQISGYAWAAQQHVSVEHVVGAYINAIEFSRLPNSAAKCRGGGGIEAHGVPYSECGHLHAKFQMPLVTRSPEAIAAWQSGAVALARRFAKLKASFPTVDHVDLPQQQGQWHRSCGFCEFYDFCSVGRSPSLVSTMLVEAPWEPFSRAFSRGQDATS